MYSLEDVWNNIITIVSDSITSTAVKTWFEDSMAVDLHENVLVLYTTSDLKRSVLKQRFAGIIQDALHEVFSCDHDLVILAGDAELEDYRKEQGKRSRPDNPLPELEGYTFEDFVVSKSNELAYSVAQHVAKEPSGKAYNPLFIYGNSGLGKTHLLLAVGTAFRREHPDAKIAYVKCEEFTNQLIASIKNGTPADFRMKYRKNDLLLMDDIQFIAGKEATQEEFYCTFDALYSEGKQIVIVSDRPPVDMSRLNDRLRTRFVGGMIAEIRPPDMETRMTILRRKAGQRGVLLSEDTITYIAERVTDNVRQLEGVVNHLSAYQQLSKLPDVTQELVDRAISVVAHVVKTLPTPESIIREVARYFHVTVGEIKGRGRQKNLTTARHVTAYLIRTLTDSVENDIGLFLEHDRSTGHASIDKVQSMLKSDKVLAEAVQGITKNIEACP